MHDRQLAHVAQRGAGLLPVVLLGEPARGLVAEEHADEEEDGWQELHRKGHDKGSVPVQVQERAVVYPEGYHGAHGFEELVQAHEHAADGAGRVFGDVGRCEHGCAAEAEAFDESGSAEG